MSRKSKIGEWGEKIKPRDLIHPSLGNHTTAEWTRMGIPERLASVGYRSDVMCMEIVKRGTVVQNKDPMSKGSKDDDDWMNYHGGDDYMAGPYGPPMTKEEVEDEIERRRGKCNMY